MKNKISGLLHKVFFFCSILMVTAMSTNAQVTVSSLSELANVAAQSNQTVVMEPGVYEMADYLTPTVIANDTPADEFNRRAMLLFSGSNNTYDFTGVTINIDTELLNDLGGNVIEFYVTGNDINFKGLTVNDIGDSPTASGGQSFTILGDNVVVKDVTLNMSGSSPYGYGDLLGKGSGNLVPMRKHSGLLVNGLNVSVIGCKIYSTSFGHLFFVQGGRNVLFQDCYAEAVTRTTDEMLAETSGPAYDLDFEAVYPNYNGDKVITSGYTKSLSECGFRTYGQGAGNTTEGVTLVNCTAKNTRVGFALEIGAPVLVKDCVAIGNEAGYNVKDVTIENSRGDAVNGPLLYLSGDASEVELYLETTLPSTTLHAVATIAGNNHKVDLKKRNDETRTEAHKIIVGATRPTGTNPFSPLGTSATSGLVLNNCTEMPVEILSNTSSSVVNTTGDVSNNGSGNIINTSSCVSTDVNPGTDEEGFVNETYEIEASSTNPDPFYGWNPDYSSTYGFMQVDEDNDQLVCTFEDNGSGYVRFYWRKTDPSLHKINSNNYPILAMKGKRPSNYSNFTLNLVNSSGATVQFKDGGAENGEETLTHAKLLPGTTDVYYWDLKDIVPVTETWELSGFNCVNTQELDPISVMRLDYLKTFKSLNELIIYENKLSVHKYQNIDGLNVYSSFENKEILKLQSEHITIDDIKIYNYLGQLVLEKKYQTKLSNVNLQHSLNSGVYVLKINNNYTKKIILY